MTGEATHSLMLLCFFLVPPSNMSNGARLGTNSTDRNSSWPSTEKCFTAAWSYIENKTKQDKRTIRRVEENPILKTRQNATNPTTRAKKVQYKNHEKPTSQHRRSEKFKDNPAGSRNMRVQQSLAL